MLDKELHDIVLGCINGHRREQHQLYQFLAPQLMKICLRYANNSDIAKDYLQDALIKIFHKIADYRNEGPFVAWAKKVTVNAIIDSIRKEGSVIKTISIDKLKDDQHSIVINDGFKQLGFADIVTLINKLPEAKKVVFNLYAIEGYTHKEIAERLHISEGTSKSQLHKARELLMEMHIEINNKTMFNENSY